MMVADGPHGSICTTGAVSALIEEAQVTLGEGSCELDELTASTTRRLRAINGVGTQVATDVLAAAGDNPDRLNRYGDRPRQLGATRGHHQPPPLAQADPGLHWPDSSPKVAPQTDRPLPRTTPRRRDLPRHAPRSGGLHMAALRVSNSSTSPAGRPTLRGAQGCQSRRKPSWGNTAIRRADSPCPIPRSRPCAALPGRVVCPPWKVNRPSSLS